MTEEGLTRYWLYDETLYRQRHGLDVLPDHIWRNGEWVFVVTSEEELRRMREITPAEAERLQAEIGT